MKPNQSMQLQCWISLLLWHSRCVIQPPNIDLTRQWHTVKIIAGPEAFRPCALQMNVHVPSGWFLIVCFMKYAENQPLKLPLHFKLPPPKNMKMAHEKVTGGQFDPLQIYVDQHCHTRTHFSLIHTYLRLNAVFSVMGSLARPASCITIGSISTRNSIHTYKS